MQRKMLVTVICCCLFHLITISQTKNLLTKDRDITFLQGVLLHNASWVSFPSYNDREQWNKIDITYRNACIKRGEELLNYTWQVVPATAYLDFVRSGNRFIMEKIRDQNNNNLKMLLLAELCEGKGRFMDQIMNGTWVLCEMTTWSLSAHLGMQKAGVGLPDVEEPIIDLFAGNTGTLLAWTHYFFHNEFDKINPLLSKRICFEINKRILQPYYQRNDFSWMALQNDSFVNNWNIWINNNVLNCILLMETDPQKKLSGVYKTMQSVDHFINHYKYDGACDEGPMYWFRAGGNLYQYLNLLSRATNGNISIFENEVIKNIGRYIYRARITDDYYINFADAAARITTDPGLVFRYGVAINDSLLRNFGSSLAWDQHWNDQLMDNESLELFLENIFNAPAILAHKQSLPLLETGWFPDNEIAFARDNTNSNKGFYFSAKGGDNGGGHSHNDVGSCILFYNGIPILIDVGRGVYTAQTFGPERYSIWYNRSAWHNLPVINGFEQKHGSVFVARDVTYKSLPGTVVFSLNIAGAYPDSTTCKKWIRTYQLIKKNSFSITDQYELQQNNGNTRYCLITPCKIKKQFPGRLVLQPVSGTSLSVNYNKTLNVKIEPISLKDTVMLHSWPSTIYRIIFEGGGQKLKGNNTIVIQPTKITEK